MCRAGEGGGGEITGMFTRGDCRGAHGRAVAGVYTRLCTGWQQGGGGKAAETCATGYSKGLVREATATH